MLAVPIIASVLLALLLTFHAADDQCRIDATKTKPVAQYMLSGVLMRRRDEGQILHIFVARLQVDGGRELLMPECQYGKKYSLCRRLRPTSDLWRLSWPIWE